MDFDEVLARADAQVARQRERDEEKLRLEERERAADERFRHLLRRWIDDAISRLEHAGVPTLLAAPNIPVPTPTPARHFGYASPRTGWRRLRRSPDPRRGLETPDGSHSEPGAVAGWLVYACTTGSEHDPYGTAHSSPSVRWGEATRYGDAVGGLTTKPLLMLTQQADAVVVASTYRLEESISEKLIPDSHRVTLSLPSGCPDHWPAAMALVGSSALELTREQLFGLSGLRLVAALPPGDPLRDSTTDTPELRNAAWDNQLVHWELGVRRLLEHHAHGYALW